MRNMMKALRLERNLSQLAVATLVGISPGYYANIERGEKNPSWENIQALAAVFGVPAEALMEKEASQAGASAD